VTEDSGIGVQVLLEDAGSGVDVLPSSGTKGSGSGDVAPSLGTEDSGIGVQVLLEDDGSGVDMPPKSVLFSFTSLHTELQTCTDDSSGDRKDVDKKTLSVQCTQLKTNNTLMLRTVLLWLFRPLRMQDPMAYSITEP